MDTFAAGYNGGKDNAARSLNRFPPKAPANLAAKVGLAANENDVFKVMNTTRVCRDFYDEKPVRRYSNT